MTGGAPSATMAPCQATGDKGRGVRRGRTPSAPRPANREANKMLTQEEKRQILISKKIDPNSADIVVRKYKDARMKPQITIRDKRGKVMGYLA